MSRVLLIALPSCDPSVDAKGSLPPGPGAEAESVRTAGLQAEVYEALSCSAGASIRVRIENAHPQVVAVAAADGTAENVRDALRAARETVPGVLTALLGVHSASLADEKPDEASADGAVGAEGTETLLGLLARLTAGERTGATHNIAAAAS